MKFILTLWNLLQYMLRNAKLSVKQKQEFLFKHQWLYSVLQVDLPPY